VTASTFRRIPGTLIDQVLQLDRDRPLGWQAGLPRSVVAHPFTVSFPTLVCDFGRDATPQHVAREELRCGLAVQDLPSRTFAATICRIPLTVTDADETTRANNAPDAEPPIDGRVARRQRNRDAVIDVVLEMFAEERLMPTIEQASKRSGLSLRSVYRYFADPGELIEAVIKRNIDDNIEAARIPHIGQGPLDERIDDFVAQRMRLYDRVGAVYRGTVHNAPNHPRIREELADTRRMFRDQFELQFAPELAALKGSRRQEVTDAGDVLTQLDPIDFLRRARQLTVAETAATLRTGLTALLRPSAD
jgi:AcrR family transcriptional regulator